MRKIVEASDFESCTVVGASFSWTDDLLGLSPIVICRVYKKWPSEEHLSCIWTHNMNPQADGLVSEYHYIGIL